MEKALVSPFGGEYSVDKSREILETLNRSCPMAKINISIPQEILEEIDALSKEENMTRSELIRKAFQTYVEVLTEKKRERKKRKGIERAVELQDEVRKMVGDMDLVKDLRNWRDRRK
jgi:Arc/MetJ-type ribon-helix-helix transcriptional regulator